MSDMRTSQDIVNDLRFLQREIDAARALMLDRVLDALDAGDIDRAKRITKLIKEALTK